MELTVIQNVIGGLCIITKELVQEMESLELRVQVEAIQITGILKSARILRRVLETWEDSLSLKLYCYEKFSRSK